MKRDQANSGHKKMANQYDHQTIEDRWQKLWQKVKLDQVNLDRSDRPFYNLMMFPYPSAEGLHVGNTYAFTGSDIYGRFKRMQGYDVFEPIGLDGFGIHSENYALKIGRHPMDHAAVTEKKFYIQLHKIGAMYDWNRTLETYDPDYYHWTQWLFVQMLKHGLAYRGRASVNFCPGCKTVLADEQVIEGKCERCGNIVEKRLLEQWFFRITAYAEKLLENLTSLDWSEKVKLAQKTWIGKKEGIDITYPVVDEKGNRVGNIVCFTTRPDTNFGATFVVLAPEHPFVKQILRVTESRESVGIRKYAEQALRKSEADRRAEGRKKTGIFTGLYCVNQLNNYKMPLYISDFVLMDFGTGAVVGVPGHDKRDFEFAVTFNLPVVRVVVAPDGKRGPIKKIEDVWEEEGRLINSDFLDGLDINEATSKMMGHLEKKGWGRRTATYHLRDWLISRQRYWGPPIPMIYCGGCAKDGKSWFNSPEAAKISSQATPQWAAGWYPVPEKDLPVILPRIEDYKPADGVAPLSKHKEFYQVKCPGCNSSAVRETEVSDTFLDSSWYFLRYPEVNSPSAGTQPFDPKLAQKWLPVHMYTGGAEHSVLHLMYSRFITMALHDWGHLHFAEPFTRFFAHGLVIKDGAKMSKSKGNVVNPDDYIQQYGADALRLYLMFMGPFSQGGDFRDTGMEGMARWLGRVWRLCQASLADSGNPVDHEIKVALAQLVRKVTDDMEKRRYNTAIAGMMEFVNLVTDRGGRLDASSLKTFLLLLAPLAPHVTEELWQQSAGRGEASYRATDSIHRQRWPGFNKELLAELQLAVVIQVNGKLRALLEVPQSQASNENQMISRARQDPKVTKFLKAGRLVKTIFVPGRLVNFVVE